VLRLSGQPEISDSHQAKEQAKAHHGVGKGRPQFGPFCAQATIGPSRAPDSGSGGKS